MVFPGASLTVPSFRQLTSREKNILWLALLLGVILILSNGIPALRGIYQERAQTLAMLRDDVAREQRLIEDAELWQQSRDDIQLREQELNTQIFPSGTAPMLTANIQRLVRQYATESGITITSTRLADSRESDGWLVVEQSLSFTLDNQSNTLAFLQRLESSQPYLGVTEFNMRHSRNQYNGDITVLGFSRLANAAVTGR
jgi:hypothetical protein